MCYHGRVKLADWARREGRAYGRLHVPAHRTPSGSIVLDPPAKGPAGRVLVYAPVPSHDHRGDPDGQVTRVTAWATGRGLPVPDVVSEGGSGLNSKRTCGTMFHRDMHAARKPMPLAFPSTADRRPLLATGGYAL